MDFESESNKNETVDLWNLIAEKILNKGEGGIKDLTKAIDQGNIYEEYHNMVFEAFAKGLRPPLKLTEEEKQKINKLINNASLRAKRGNMNKKMTSETIQPKVMSDLLMLPKTNSPKKNVEPSSPKIQKKGTLK